MNSPAIASTRMCAGRTAQWAAVALGASIPISTALDNVLLVVVLASCLLAGNLPEAVRFIKRSRTALAALVLYGLLLAGMLYGERDAGDGIRTLGKYSDLLFIPLFAVLLRENRSRQFALYGFAGALLLMLALSYLLAAGVALPAWLAMGNAAVPAVFKQYLTQAILLAFGSFLFTEFAIAASTRMRSVFWAVAALLAAANVMLLLPGRTGHIVLVALVLYLGYGWRGWRGLAATVAAAVLMIAALVQFSTTFQERYGLGDLSRALASQARESNKQRLDFYRTSLAILKEHPLLGVGTGGFARAYAEKTRGTDAFQTRNPHNEYLHIAVQLGPIGLAVLLWLFWQHWRESARLAKPLECHLSRGIVLTIAIACLFNSLLLDHTEGLLYAWLTGMLFGGLESKE